jgi:hypothetical protein
MNMFDRKWSTLIGKKESKMVAKCQNLLCSQGTVAHVGMTATHPTSLQLQNL